MDQKRLDMIREIKQKDSQLDESSRKISIANKNKRISKKKKTLVKKTIKTTIIALGSFYLGILAVCNFELLKGTNAIFNEYSEEHFNKYEIKLGENGRYIVNPDGIPVATYKRNENIPESHIHELAVKDYEKSEGSSKAWIVAEEALGIEEANNLFGEKTREEINETKKMAYHEEELQEYSNGGISK